MTALNGLRVMKPVKWEHKQMVGILQKWWKAQRDHCGFFIQNIWFSPVWSDWVEPALEVVGEMLWDITRNSSSKQAMSLGIFMHPEKICFMWRTRIFLFSVSLFSSFLFFFLCFALLLSVLLFCAPPLFSSLFLLADQKVFWAFRIISTWKWHILHICNIFDVCVYVHRNNLKVSIRFANSWEADSWSQIQDCQWGIQTYSKICSLH